MPEDYRTDNRSPISATSATRTTTEEWPPWRGKKQSFIDWRNAANWLLFIMFLSIGYPSLFLIFWGLATVFEYLPTPLGRLLLILTGLLLIPAVPALVLAAKALTNRIIEPND